MHLQPLFVLKCFLVLQVMRLVKQHFRFGLVKQVLQTTYHVATTNYLIAPTILGGLSTLQQSVTVLLETMFVCCVHVHQATAPKLYGAVVLYMDSGVLDKTNKPASTWFNLSEHFVAKSCDSLKRAERSSCFTFFEKIPIWISKKDKNERNEPNRSVSLFTLRGHKDKLETLLQACEKAAPSDTSPCVYHTANDGTACSTSWAMSHMLSTKKASNFCFKDDDNTNGFAFLLNDLKRFLASEAWYKQMNLAYRRGYLLHGPPGTGKTTLIAQLASTLGLNLCVLDLAEPALDDTTLRLRVDNAPKNSIILLEDVDSALRSPSHTTRHDNNNTHEDTPSTWAGGSANPPNDKTFSFLEGMSHKPLSCVTHRGILALLDGQLSNSDAQVFFLTTNFKDALPKNMIRPGRCDVDQKIGLASMAQSKFVFLKFFPEATEDDLAELHRHVKPLTRSMAELEGCCIRYRDSPKLALHNLSLLQDSVTRRSDFFEYLASAGLHKTWFKFVDNHLESLHDVAQLDDEDRKSLKIGVLDVENQAYTPRIAKRFNDFLSFGPQSLANLTRRVPCAQLATILSSEFQIGNAQAMIEAQRVGSAYPNLSWWQLKRATSLCPRNFGGFDDALKLAVKTQKDKRFYTRQNNKLDMKTFCWHAGLWDLHARFGAKTIGDVMRDVNSTGCVNKFRTRITYLTYEEALRVGASLLGTPNYSFDKNLVIPRVCPHRGKLATYLLNRYEPDEESTTYKQVVGRIYQIVDILAPIEMSCVSWLIIHKFFESKPSLDAIEDKDVHALTVMPQKVQVVATVRPPKPKSYTWIARFLRQFRDMEERCLDSFVKLRLTCRDVVANMSEESLLANKIEFASFLAAKLADPSATTLPDLPGVNKLVTTKMSRSLVGRVIDINLGDLLDEPCSTCSSKLPPGTATIYFKAPLNMTLYAWPVDKLVVQEESSCDELDYVHATN